MQLKLKEIPKEWRKFAVVTACVLGLILWLLRRSGGISVEWAQVSAGLVGLALLAGLIWPRGVRPVYRAAMTFSFYVGQVMGRVLLAALFLLILTPLGLALRLMGKDLLQLKRAANAKTYWRSARWSEDFDRQF